MGMMDRDYYKDIYNKREAEAQKHALKSTSDDNKYTARTFLQTSIPKKKIKVPLSVWDLVFYAVFVFIALRTFGNFISTYNSPLQPKIVLGLTLFCAVTILIFIHRQMKRWSMTSKRNKNQKNRKGW